MGRSMKTSVGRSLGAMLLLCLVGGCDRGTHPQQLGTPAPQFALDDGQQRVSLGSLRGQGVVLHFWATWCAPCIAELPSLEILQQELPQVKVLAVAFDEDSATYQAYLQRHPLPIETVLDARDAASQAFGTFRPPETYVIDRSGTIRRKFIGAQDWTSPEIVNELRQIARQT